MDACSRFLLAFIFALRRVTRRTEIFAFNTSLTRLTPWLRTGDVAGTLERLARNVQDWSGGTRIGECLLAFVDHYLRHTVRSDTTVLILSDGLDRGDTGSLETALLAIRRRARRIIWLNPLMGDPRYRPEAKGMQGGAAARGPARARAQPRGAGGDPSDDRALDDARRTQNRQTIRKDRQHS